MQRLAPRRATERESGAAMISTAVTAYSSAVAEYMAAHGLELAGVVTAALGIWLTTRRLLICWPITLVSIFIYMVVFFRAGLFSDALLQVFFVVFTVYGWWHWWRGVRDEGEVRVVPLSRSEE